MDGGVVGVHPAGGLGPGPGVERDQLAHPQAAAVEQLDDGVVARGQGGVAGLGHLAGQGHGLVHRQGLGQRLGRLGRADAVHRVERHAAAPAPPAVQAAPGRELQRQAARRQAGRSPAPCSWASSMRTWWGCSRQRHGQAAAPRSQAAQRVGVERQRALGHAPLHLQDW
jgi:hypothetical protein